MPQWENMHLVLMLVDVPGKVVHKGDFPFSGEKRKGLWAEESVRVGLGGKAGSVLQSGCKMNIYICGCVCARACVCECGCGCVCMCVYVYMYIYMNV